MEKLTPKSNQKPTEMLQDLDLAHHIHPFTDQKDLKSKKPLIIVRGEGVYIFDSDGRKYLDGMAGLWLSLIHISEPTRPY